MGLCASYSPKPRRALFNGNAEPQIAVLVIVCPIMLGFLKNKKWLIIYVSAAAVALLCMLLFGGKLVFIPRIDNFFQDISLRIGIWKGAIKSILDAPLFGRGYNTYVRINNLYGSFDAAHSITAFGASYGFRHCRNAYYIGLLRHKHRQDNTSSQEKHLPYALCFDDKRNSLRTATRSIGYNHALAADEPACNVRHRLFYGI